MIRRYNIQQILRAVFHLLCGLFCYFLAYLFFHQVPSFTCGLFKINFPTTVAMAVTVMALVAVTVSGFRTWQAGGGLCGYHESAFYHDLGVETGGAVVVDHYAHRITGTAHVLSQIFLAGPLGLLNFGTTLSSLVPDDRELERRLQATLARLQAANKWQPITDHPDLVQEILYLSRMRLIDFSTAKGIPRIKAHTIQSPARPSS